MEKDDAVIPQGEEVQEIAAPEPELEETGEEEDKDYRGKLNATNRFLKKEGYTFKNGEWIPPEPVKKEPAKEQKTFQEEVLLSPKDIFALSKSDIDQDDFDEVLGYAKYRGISVGDALKDKTLKTILEEKKEERATAQATHIKGGGQGAKKTTGDTLLRKAQETGEVPDDEEGIRKLVDAQMASRMNNN